MNYYPVHVKNHGKKPQPDKRKRISQSKIRLIALICLALIALSSGTAYIINKILNPDLIKVILEPSLDYVAIGVCGDGILAAYKDGKCGLIDKYGKIIAPLIYDNIHEFFDGVAIAYKNNKYGFIDKNGDVVIDFIYDDASYFNEGLALVFENGKYGYINKNGEIVIPFNYDYADSFSDGFANVCQNDKWGIIDITGNAVIPSEHEDYIRNIGNGLFWFREETGVVLINKNGEVIFLPGYDHIGSFKEGLAIIRKDGKWGYIDMTGEIVIPIEYRNAWNFNDDGLAIVEIPDGKNRVGLSYVRAWKTWGYINKNGEIVLTVKYNNVYDFSENLAMVSNFDSGGGYNAYQKFGYINRNGELVIPMIYESACEFENGLAAVCINNNKYGVINTAGEIVIPLIYDDIRFVDGGRLIIAGKDWKYGILNNKGEIVLPFEYDLINGGRKMKDHLLCIEKDGLWGIIEIRK